MQNDITKQQEKKELVHRGLTIDYKHIPLSILDNEMLVTRSTES